MMLMSNDYYLRRVVDNFFVYRANRSRNSPTYESTVRNQQGAQQSSMYEMLYERTDQPGANAPARNTAAGERSTNATTTSTSPVDSGRAQRLASSPSQDVKTMINDLYGYG